MTSLAGIAFAVVTVIVAIGRMLTAIRERVPLTKDLTSRAPMEPRFGHYASSAQRVDVACSFQIWTQPTPRPMAWT